MLIKLSFLFLTLSGLAELLSAVYVLVNLRLSGSWIGEAYLLGKYSKVSTDIFRSAQAGSW